MSLLTQVATQTSTDVNISSALLSMTFTNTTRIRKVFVNVFLDQIAGNGAYQCYYTIQRAGAGSAYKGPVSVVDVASGVTAAVFNSIAITLNATDVLKVYVQGLAGDTTTVDSIVDVNEEHPGTIAPAAALTGLPTNFFETMKFSIQVAQNKLNYNKATDQMILYEDNSSTAKLTHSMTDDASNATRGKGA